MMEVLKENARYQVGLDEDSSVTHLPHRSWGTYRVVDRKANVLFETANRDKAFGVFEYLSLRENLLPPQSTGQKP
jgi:hypothetical protein